METHTHASQEDAAPAEALSALRRFTRARPAVERCELCSAEVPGNHPHLLHRASHQIACSCDACAILFCGQQGAKFLRVPKRMLKLEGFAFSEAEWDAMTLPIHLAFFLRGHADESTALYPSPAGVMESLIELPPWPRLTRSDPVLASIEPEVETLLVNRIGNHSAYFIVPLDTAYRLVGLVRTKWRGLSGGAEVWQAISDFFSALERQSTSIGDVTHA
jgi:hypothetical protein